jgi:rare lipoprotein A (peptidoglycan hydrolase)
MRRRKQLRLVLIGAVATVWAAGLVYVIASSSSGGLKETPVAKRTTPAPATTAPQVADVPAPAPVDEPDAYRPLPKPRPTLVEPEAGVPSSAQQQESASGDNGSSGAGKAPSSPPSDAEIRAELRQLRSYYASLPAKLSPTSESAPFELTAGQLSRLTGWQSSVASVYFDYGGPLACGGRLRRDQFGVANKNLPCGTMVTFRYGGRALRVPVIDRGPYIAGREWDLTGATAIALGFPGLGPVDWIIG